MADYLKIPEVARRLDVSEKTARRYVKAGTLPSTFIGGAYRVTEEDLEEFLHRAEVKPEPEAPKVPRRSPSEPSFNDILEDERRIRSVVREGLSYARDRAEYYERQIDDAGEGSTRSPGAARFAGPHGVLQLEAQMHDEFRGLYELITSKWVANLDTPFDPDLSGPFIDEVADTLHRMGEVMDKMRARAEELSEAEDQAGGDQLGRHREVREANKRNERTYAGLTADLARRSA